MKALALVAALLLAGCASTPSTAPSPLPEPVRAELARQQLPDTALAYIAFPADAPSQARSWQPGRSMAPASTMKVVTAIVALDRLGPNWRGRVELLAGGPVVKGVLDGPLVLRGGAATDFDWGALASLLREARESGLHTVRGGLLIDRSLFRPARLDVGQPPFDEAPEFPYNAIPDALHLNGALLNLQLQSTTAGLQARWSPAWPGLAVDASAVAIDPQLRCADWDTGWQAPTVAAQAAGVQVQLAGRFPADCRQQQALTLVDRDALAAQATRQIWQELGGTLQGELREGSTPAGATRLALHQAPPLAEWLRGAIKRSDNPLTRLLFLQLGAAHPQAASFASSREAAGAQVQAWVREQGLNGDSLVTDNGSGLSRSERISPELLAGMIHAALAKPYAPELLAGLPLAGRDGTLANRLKGTAAENNARLKTGTLRDAVGLAGVLKDRGGRLWVVAAFVNHDNAPAKGRPVLDALIAQLADQP